MQPWVLCSCAGVHPSASRVRLCRSQSCYRTLMDRDTNAAINILGIAARWLFELPKPPAFRRQHEQQAAARAAEQVLEAQAWAAQAAAAAGAGLSAQAQQQHARQALHALHMQAAGPPPPPPP